LAHYKSLIDDDDDIDVSGTSTLKCKLFSPFSTVNFCYASPFFYVTVALWILWLRRSYVHRNDDDDDDDDMHRDWQMQLTSRRWKTCHW